MRFVMFNVRMSSRFSFFFIKYTLETTQFLSSVNFSMLNQWSLRCSSGANGSEDFRLHSEQFSIDSLSKVALSFPWFCVCCDPHSVTNTLLAHRAKNPTFSTKPMGALTAWQWLHVLPRLDRFACFPALSTGCIYSRAWHGLHVFPHL